MEKFKLKIDMTNAAFEDNPDEELARILQDLAFDLAAKGIGRTESNLRDINGNAVGKWSVK